MSDYSGESIALLTQHGKESVISPVLEPALGCKVELVRGFDTDQLGTFTRDKPRPGSQLDAARRKARTGMELSGLKVGIASEGSFGPDPFTGLFDWNVELLILIDDRMVIEVVGSAQAAGKSSHLQTGDWGQAKAFAEREGFPAHQLVLRPQSQSDPRLQKGISDWGQLQTVFMSCKAQAANGQVFVETDLRAFANPTRMHVIGEAAKDLLMRLQSHCPTCAKPGYWVTERLPGLPCALCGLPTRIYQTEVWQCTACSHRTAKTRTDETKADPRHCSHCNP